MLGHGEVIGAEQRAIGQLPGDDLPFLPTSLENHVFS
jgi:hypothetical protein